MFIHFQSSVHTNLFFFENSLWMFLLPPSYHLANRWKVWYEDGIKPQPTAWEGRHALGNSDFFKLHLMVHFQPAALHGDCWFRESQRQNPLEKCLWEMEILLGRWTGRKSLNLFFQSQLNRYWGLGIIGKMLPQMACFSGDFGGVLLVVLQVIQKLKQEDLSRGPWDYLSISNSSGPEVWWKESFLRGSMITTVDGRNPAPVHR